MVKSDEQWNGGFHKWDTSNIRRFSTINYKPNYWVTPSYGNLQMGNSSKMGRNGLNGKFIQWFFLMFHSRVWVQEGLFFSEEVTQNPLNHHVPRYMFAIVVYHGIVCFFFQTNLMIWNIIWTYMDTVLPRSPSPWTFGKWMEFLREVELHANISNDTWHTSQRLQLMVPKRTWITSTKLRIRLFAKMIEVCIYIWLSTMCMTMCTSTATTPHIQTDILKRKTWVSVFIITMSSFIIL